MKYLIPAIRWLAYVYLGLALILIVGSYVLIALKHGFWHLAEILSPLNVINWVVTVLTIAPGLGLLWLSKKLEERQEPRSSPSV